MNKFAIIDLGSNSCRLYIMEQRDGKAAEIRKERRVVRLGSGSFHNNTLKYDGMSRAAAALSEFKAIIDSMGVQKITAYATSAVRDAENKADFIQMIKQQTGISLQVLSGSEEAEAVYDGLKLNLPLSMENDLFLDIGGGSTEIICANCNNISFMESFRIGAVRLYESMLNNPDTVSDTKYNELKDYVKNTVAPFADYAASNLPRIFYGTSGTAVNLAAATAIRLKTNCSGNFSVNASDMRQTISMLRNMTHQEKQSVPGLVPDRADIIIAGAAILDSIMELSKAETLTITGFSIKDGMAARQLI